MLIGAHVSGGLGKLVENARACGATAVQTFASNPRGWAMPARDAAVEEVVRRSAPGPVFFHAPYLVNLATSSDENLARSVATLIWTVKRAEACGAAGVVVHAGQTTAGRAAGLARFEAAARLVLDTPAGVPFVIELTAGGGGALGSRWPQAAELLERVGGDDRVRFCFDTCHAYAAGYDISTAAGMDACLEEMEREIGAGRLALVHANDTRDALGSHRDRHWHVGEGNIGDEGFRALVRRVRVPLVVETPGKLDEHRRNIERLRGLDAGP